MAKKTVLCIASSRGQAELVVDRLHDAGFSNGDISVLVPDQEMEVSPTRAGNSSNPSAAAAGAGAGGVMGGALGWLAGVGMLTIPGAGPFIAAGPLMTTLSGAVVGAAAGGIVGALMNMGVPEPEARHYESSIRKGKTLISVHAEGPEEIEAAGAILRRAGTEDIAVMTDLMAEPQNPEPANPFPAGSRPGPNPNP